MDAATAGFAVFLSLSGFFLAFLLSNVLNDYKEAERLASVLAISLDALGDVVDLCGTAHELDTTPHHAALLQLGVSIIGVLGRRLPEWAALDALSPVALTLAAAADSCGAGPALVARVLAESHTMRAALARIQTIADVSLVAEGYALADAVCAATAALLVFGARYADAAAAYTTIAFFVGLFVYVCALIRAMDDPFMISQATIDGALRGHKNRTHRSAVTAHENAALLGADHSLLMSPDSGVVETPTASQVSIASLVHALDRLRLSVHGSTARANTVEDCVLTLSGEAGGSWWPRPHRRAAARDR